MDRMAVRHIVRFDAAHMQKAEVRGIDIALQRLQPVALPLDHSDNRFALWHQVGFERGEFGHLFSLAHIDPDNAVALLHRIGLGPHLVGEVLLFGEVWLLQALAVCAEFPAMIDAADAIILGTSKE